ncbi:hypothetical protein [Crassaminicella indica]|uniref:DUF2127 domain-containing protein n=1 Tax=Crassaminicella indica TaxID=2855394 RepID=A0ABX8RAQ4_9CLOT|nr:hypothetical protein [Crassaminicella indica]QXM05544.1 hypothetical protein KVH43_09180 [Crassaminicella indica]
MKRKFNIINYILKLLLGVLCTFFSNKLLNVYNNTWLTIDQSFHSIQTIANHPIAGIFLALIGFILLFYLIFVTANALLSYWFNLKLILRIFIILWIILLFTAILYQAINLYNILGYIFIFSVTIFSFFLMLNYFAYKK